MESNSTNFLEIATAAVDRGFAVIPLQPGAKDPDYSLVGKINGETGTGGACRRSRDPETIAAWAKSSPNANVGVCSDERITILESDNEQQFRQLVRDLSREMFGEARELPATLTSQAREGRPHFFFAATPRTNSIEGAPGIQGLFEWRRENQYVVGPGSLHPTGVHYRIVNDAPIAPMPDWLVDVLLEIKKAYQGEQSAAGAHVKVGPAAIARNALIKKYRLDPKRMLADESFELFVGAGERHYFLQAMAGLLHDGQTDEDELCDILKQMRDKYCEAGKGDYEVENIVSWTMQKAPCTIEPDFSDLPFLDLGCHVFTEDSHRLLAWAKTKWEEKWKARPPASALQFTKPGREGSILQGVLEPMKTYDCWFPRGRPHAIAGASGSGKSTFVLDMLRKQEQRQYILGHRGAGLSYKVLFSDRGKYDNEETLERLGIDPKDPHYHYLSDQLWDVAAAHAIKDFLENLPEMPDVLFVEGADLMLTKAAEMPCVTAYLSVLKRVAEHYFISIILSVGKPGGGCSSGHWVSSNIDDGKYIKLEDGSLWEVDDGDTVDSAMWLETDDVTVCNGKLIDTDDKHSVDAKRIH